MQINEQAPVVKRDSILIHASPEKVWSILTDINKWPDWNTSISRAALKGEPLVGSTFSWTINGVGIQSILHSVVPYSTFGWSGKTIGTQAIHNWYLEAREGSTLVRVEESMQGWIPALFKRKMNEDLEKDMRRWLEWLKAKSES